jgi:5-methylcytosine-specific restriction endonuclease McrA
MWRRKNRKRRLARLNAGDAGRYTLAEVADRDGCCCHICGRKVNMALSGMRPGGPTIDHLIPISADGPDTIDNVALAHRQCNTERGVGGFAQLRLVG